MSNSTICPSKNENTPEQDANIYNYEIHLMDYFLVLWKHKRILLLGSIFPTLLAVLFFYVSPRPYQYTFRYDVSDFAREAEPNGVIPKRLFYCRFGDWGLSEGNYDAYLDSFYSQKNTDQIKTKSSGYETSMVSFEVFPPYPDYSDILESRLNSTQIKKLREITPQFLIGTCTHTSKKMVSAITSAVMENTENVMPMYLMKNQIANITLQYKAKIVKMNEGK